MKHRKIFLYLAILWTAVIWCHSLQTAVNSASASSQVHGFLTPLLNWLTIPQEAQHAFVRKLGHWAEFAVLGALWMPALLPGDVSWRQRILPVLGVCMATAFADETIQLFIPGRAGMIVDLWIDGAGSAAGMAFSECLQVLWKKMRS